MTATAEPDRMAEELTASEFAALVGCHRTTLTRYVAAGHLTCRVDPATGGRLFRRADVAGARDRYALNRRANRPIVGRR